ncbi:MAG: mechanosensitive ion channel, partial [Nitrospirota bacterium]|nr:mechanosensitive ion channel [Nitrospirota bacterium]
CTLVRIKLALIVGFLIGLSQTSALPTQVMAASPDKSIQFSPDVSPGTSSETTAQGSESAAAAELQRKRAVAETELSGINSPPTLRKGAPPGTTDARLMERRSLLQQLVQIYEQHLDALRKLDHMRLRVRDVERQNNEWDGFPTPGPYSVLMIDDLRDAARSMALAAQGIQTRLTMTESVTESTRHNLKASQEQARHTSERLEGVQDPVKREALSWDRDLAQLRERVESARTGMLEAEKTLIQEELTEANQRVALLNRQRTVAAQQAEFTKQDHDKIKKRLDADHQALMSELDRAVLAQAAQRQAVAASEAKLAAADAAATSKTSSRRPKGERVTHAAESVELARLQFDNDNLHVDLLRQMVNGLEHERHIWDIRYATAQGSLSVIEERNAFSKLAAAAKQIRGWKEYGLQQLGMVGSHISEVESRLDETPSSATAQYLNDVLRAYRHREDLYRRMLQRTDSLLGLIEHRQTEFVQREQARSVMTRLEDWGTSALAVFENVWNVELFTAEDTIEVDGKSVTGHRSVTVGKVLSALAILIVGYWCAVVLARFAEKQAITRLQVDPNVANIIRQWALAFLFLMLVIMTLMFVKIPITAFAFLGGALAIGVGFGTQNLLKNVISGLLLLMERPLRVGDVIEVDGIRGMVTSIGLRSSTIRDINGVETLIPNSNLLERNLTNWTYSSFRKRYSIGIAVATGSDARRVKEMLGELAGRHGQILKEPAPYVLFEDFSEHALVFALNYWIEIGPNIDSATVSSDLRFMIENTFAEAKIVRK